MKRVLSFLCVWLKSCYYKTMQQTISQKGLTIKTNDRLKNIIVEVLSDLESIGIVCPDKVLFKPSTAYSRYGWCKSNRFKDGRAVNPKLPYDFVIGISVHIVNDSDVKDVVAHEILHAVAMSAGQWERPHRLLWKNMAKQVNASLGYNVQTTGKNIRVDGAPKRRKRRKVLYFFR